MNMARLQQTRTTRSRRRRTAIAAAIAVACVAPLATPASADTITRVPNDKQDGFVYLRLDSDRGPLVRYSGNVSNLGAVANRNIAVENDGYGSLTNHAVNLFFLPNGWASGVNSAYACIDYTTNWHQGSGGERVTFSRGLSNAAGKGQSIWKNVASIQWVSRCSG